MNPSYLVLATILIVAQIILPRRYAFAPLLASAVHIGNIEFLGEFSLPRLLIVLGIGRALATGTFRWSASNPIDVMMVIFALAAYATAGAHMGAGYNPYVANTGLVLNVCGAYLYGRALLDFEGWAETLARVSVILLLPLALLMVQEMGNGKNPYAALGVTGPMGEDSMTRDGKVRARGPFGHAILAGTAGAVTLPLCLILWRRQRVLAIAGIAGCVAVVITSASSGPLAAFLAGIGGIYFWRRRDRIKQAKLAIVAGIVFLHFYMTRPWYYIIDSIDFTGGSTGWHRARLIQVGIENLSEWWLAGTDYTRHWMATGVSWNPNHTDITNYYLHLGVVGGLPLTLSLIVVIWLSARGLLRSVSLVPGEEKTGDFAIWCVGISLFAHALSFISISYFDQMFVLFWILVGGISSHVASTKSAEADEEEAADDGGESEEACVPEDFKVRGQLP